MASFSITESVKGLAEGSAEAANSAALISIAASLLSIGMVMYEERENRCGRFAHGRQDKDGADYPEGWDVFTGKDPVQ